MSMLRKCEQCHAMIAKGQPCPECHWHDAEEQEEGAPPPPVETLHEFARREATHMRNYMFYMVTMIGTGLVGLLTAIMWFRFIFFGDIRAFLLIVVLSVVTGGLGLLVKFFNYVCPTALHCPACELRLDQLGTIAPHCPNCSAQLKAMA